MKPLIVAATLLAIGAAATGCDAVNEALTPKDSDEARAAVESTALTRREASLLMAIADATPLGSTPAEMAAAVEAALPDVFSPAGCLRVEAVDATVTATLDGCAGPRALSLSGIVNVVFAADAADSVALTVTSTDLGINDATMTINATGTYTRDADLPLLAVSTQGGGTGPGGTIVGRLGAYTVAWDGDCYAIDGQWTSSVDTRFFLTSVNDLWACDGYCPAEGTIVYGQTEAPDDPDADISAEALTITFIASDGAPWIATNGDFGNQALSCAEDPQSRPPPSDGDSDDDFDE